MTLLAPVVGLALCEGALRWLLFSSWPLARQWGQGFREAGLYVPTTVCDEYHELRFLFSPPDQRRSSCVPHPDLGWISAEFEPETLRHPDEERIQGRRPVLLFGSSYAACWFPVETCFEQLLEGSPLAKDYCLINYGVPAYGLDQSILLAAKAVPRFAALDPVVILTLVVDSDLPRSQVSFFQAPKPRFVAGPEGFRLVPPDELDPFAYIERHPPAITSYLARYVLYGAGLLPESFGQRREDALELERRRLAAFCLGRAHAELEALGLEHFVVLFHSALSFLPLGGLHVDELPLLAYLEKNGIRYQETRGLLEEECQRTGKDARELYLHGPGTVWHPNERGTEVLFQAIRLGLEERRGPAR